MKKPIFVLFAAFLLSGPLAFADDPTIEIILKKNSLSKYFNKNFDDKKPLKKILALCPLIKNFVFDTKDTLYAPEDPFMPNMKYFAFVERLQAMNIHKMYTLAFEIEPEKLLNFNSDLIPDRDAFIKNLNFVNANFWKAEFHFSLSPTQMLIVKPGLSQWMCNLPLHPITFHPSKSGFIMYSIPFDKDAQGNIIPLDVKIN